MNNPNVSNINEAIENKLQQNGLLGSLTETMNKSNDIFKILNISKESLRGEPTDLEKEQFMNDSFHKINNLMQELCRKIEKENDNIKIYIQSVDSRTIIYKFYKNGKQVRFLKLFLENCLSVITNSIGISCDEYSFRNSNSYNGIISSKVEDGELKLYFSISSSFNQKCMLVEEVVKEIWVNYIKPYIN